MIKRLAAIFAVLMVISQGILVAVASPARDDTTVGLVSCWDFEEESGTRYDAVGDNDLTDYNTVTRGSGRDGYAASFDAANSEYLAIDSNSTLATGDEDFTWAAWIWPDYASPEGAWLIHKDND